ncbi:hypothetical protein KX928_08995 [Roseobacter sp. YSTF-M11]|uniref:Uncharacterized protein n=1 Tax=Roseobacter insulae TaxID=2859783 RepID=A0A9X1FUQ5_9RHOB|nr:hypothetical protein [Roseobacter insulae]MBW4707921.1 hypothetical protein [Roseobacter insulae]
MKKDLEDLWASFTSNVNWNQPHYLDKERLYRFFSHAHLQGEYVGQDLIGKYYPEPAEDSAKYDRWAWLVSEADIAGELLKTYDKERELG